MTLFRLSVALHTGDLDGALLAAADIGPAWTEGPRVPAASAQIRLGAGIACLLKDEPDGAAAWARRVLGLPSGLRIATVTAWLADLYRHPAEARYARAAVVAGLRQQVRRSGSSR